MLSFKKINLFKNNEKGINIMFLSKKNIFKIFSLIYF